MRLYEVKVVATVIVAAESYDEAEEVALQAVEDDDGGFEKTCDVSDLTYMPWGWTGKELPYVASDEVPERSINAWIEAGAAPALSARMARKAAGK